MKKKTKKKKTKQKMRVIHVTAKMPPILKDSIDSFRKEMRLLNVEIQELAENVSGLSNVMEDINSSLWDGRQAMEVQSGRLLELARLIKESDKPKVKQSGAQ